MPDAVRTFIKNNFVDWGYAIFLEDVRPAVVVLHRFRDGLNIMIPASLPIQLKLMGDEFHITLDKISMFFVTRCPRSFVLFVFPFLVFVFPLWRL